MEKGSGIISPSIYSYNIGDRIKTICDGYSSDFGNKLGEYCADIGDKGEITGLNGDYIEILYDNGRYGYRCEYSKEENIKIIGKVSQEPQYEIY